MAGGSSTRMGRDKAALEYGGAPQLVRGVDLLRPFCEQVFISIRQAQSDAPVYRGLPQIHDAFADCGPIAGVLSAQRTHPNAAWFVLACDLPYLDAATCGQLVAGRDPSRTATAFRNPHDGLPEPLCTIYEPSSCAQLKEFFERRGRSLRRFLGESRVNLLEVCDETRLGNVNSPEEYEEASGSFQD